MIRSKTVKQSISYITVSSELRNTLDDMANKGWKVLNVFETVVTNGVGCSTQGFIVIYDDMQNVNEEKYKPTFSFRSIFSSRNKK